MAFLVLFGLGVILVLGALRTLPRGGGSRLYLVISALPLVLMMFVASPIAWASRSPADWARKTSIAVSQAGLALSFVLAAIGAVLVVRAVLAGDRQTAAMLTLDTALAALPAGIITAYLVLGRLL